MHLFITGYFWQVDGHSKAVHPLPADSPCFHHNFAFSPAIDLQPVQGVPFVLCQLGQSTLKWTSQKKRMVQELRDPLVALES